MNKDLPLVAINMAMTADGKTASPERKLTTFGSEADTDHLFKLRSQFDGVMCGARTIDLNDFTLETGGPRFESMRRRNKLQPHHQRIVVSGSASLSPESSLFESSPAPIILCSARASKKNIQRLQSKGATIVQTGDKSIDFTSALITLRKKHRIRTLLVEGGGTLNDALIRADLVERLHLTICPLIMTGQDSCTIADGLGFPTLADASIWRLESKRLVKNEIFLTYARAR